MSKIPSLPSKSLPRCQSLQYALLVKPQSFNLTFRLLWIAPLEAIASHISSQKGVPQPWSSSASQGQDESVGGLSPEQLTANEGGSSLPFSRTLLSMCHPDPQQISDGVEPQVLTGVTCSLKHPLFAFLLSWSYFLLTHSASWDLFPNKFLHSNPLLRV